ncbi:MAG: hypothetical protein Q8902_11550 [Bacteroidota bacterium]|nr:hypothetical protein [Bacteroidota bacterium]
MNNQQGSAPKSWADFPIMSPIDPRAIIQTSSFQDNVNARLMDSRIYTWQMAVAYRLHALLN